jgi:hypothetical protein
MTRFARRHLAFLLLALAAPLTASAVTHEVSIYLDLDDDAATGCEVTTVDGPFAGAEQVLITTVETSSPPEMAEVTDVAIADCVDEMTDTFGPASSFDGNWPVGIGNGVGGRDVVETYVPLVQLLVDGPSIVRLGVVVTDEQGGEEALLTVDDTPDGAPILLDLQSILEIPTLGEWGLVLLALLLAALSVRLLGRRGTAAVGLLLLLLAGGVAWAAVSLDGLTSDWSAADQLASNGIVLFAKEGTDSICFRVDVDLLFNSPPDAVDDGFMVAEDSMDNVLAVLGNDSDPEMGTLTVTGVGTPDQGGTATTDGTTVTYTPAADFAGVETFTYTVEDDGGATDTATVTVTVSDVNDDPTAADDSPAVLEDSVSNPLDVLANDTDAPDSGETLTITGVGATDQGGTVSIVGGGSSLEYTPTADFAGVETFTYTISDGHGGTDSATVTVTVSNVNDDPDAVDDGFMVDEDTMDHPLDVLANDTGAPDTGETLTLTGVGTPAQGGAVSIVGGGSSLEYTPAADFAGVETFTYSISDGNGGTDTAAVTVTVNDANDDPPACAADMATTDEDTSAMVLVLANDSDPDPGETATLTVLSVDTTGTTGMVTDNGTDVTYDPNSQFESLGSADSAIDTFTYIAQDADGLTCMATVTVTVNGVNDAPMVDDESFDFACNLEGVVETVPAQMAAPSSAIFRSVVDNVLVGDSDAEGGVSIVAADGTTVDTSPPFEITTDEGGSLVLHADGSFTFTPEAGDRGVADGFTYTIQDAEGAQDTATVTLNVADSCVWFVDNSVSGVDDDGTGTSPDPFTSLVDELGPDNDPDDAEDASQPGDVIYVFAGDSRTGAPYDGNFAAEADERLLGEGVDLVVDFGGGPETLFTGDPANRPMVEGVSAGVGVSVNDVTGVEVAGLELTGGDHSFTASASTAALGVDFHDNVTSGSSNQSISIAQNGPFASTVALTGNTVASATGAGIEVEASDGTLELALDGNTDLTSSSTAIDLDGGGGALYVTSFCGNVVSGDTTGTGVQMLDVIFDADPADADFTGDEVSCGTGTTIGSVGNPVDGFGMVLDGITGDLDLGQLDIFVGVPGGGDDTALEVFATGSFDAATGSGFQLKANGGTVSSIDGPAIVIDPTDLESFVLTNVISQDSAGAGIHLEQVSGSFQVTGTTDVDAAAGTGIEILASPVDALFATTDIDNTTGSGVRYINGATGTLTFSGPLTIDTTSGGGLAADSGGTLEVLDSTSTITTTTGTGVSVTDSTIGGGGMSFASVSVSGAADGIILIAPGAGAFSAAGGSLQNVTSRGLDIGGGSGDVTYGGSISTTATGRSVEVTNYSGGSAVDLTGPIDDNGLGISLTSNGALGGSTITFSGGLDLDTGANAAFTATSGGTVNVLSDAVTTSASTTTGTVVEIADTAIGSSGVFFDLVESSGGANGILLDNAGFGAFTANGGTLLDQTARGVDVAGGAGNVTVGASISTTASGRSVEVTGHGGVVVDFNGPIDDDGLGIHLDSNTGSIIRFDGQLDLDTGSNTAFNATNGGTVVVTAFGNDVDTSTGIGVNIVDTTIGAADVELQSVSVNGAPHGIVLDSTGTSGQFRVLGDGSSTFGVTDRDGSGGTLASTTSHSVLLAQATGVFLSQMNLTGSGADGLHSTGGGQISLQAVAITDPAGDGWEAADLTGTNRIFSDSLISGIDNAGTSGVIVSNTNVDLTSLTLDGSTFTDSTGGQGMVVMRGLGTSNMTLVISDGNTADAAGSLFSNLNQSAVVISAGTDAGSTSTITTNISETHFRDGPVGGFNNVEIQALENGTANFDISGNSFFELDPPGANSGIVLLQATGNGTLGASSGANGTVSGNGFGQLAGRRGIHITSNGNASNHNVSITGNRFRDLEREALFVSARDNTAAFDLRVSGNSFGDAANPVGSTDREAVEITAENSAVLNAELLNNDLVNTSGSGFSQALRLVSLDDAVLNVSIRRSNPPNAATANRFQTIGTDTAFTAQTDLGGTSTLCLDLTGNDALSSAGASGGGTYALTETTGTFNVVDRDNTNASNAGTVTFTPAIGSFGDVGSCPAPIL